MTVVEINAKDKMLATRLGQCTDRILYMKMEKQKLMENLQNSFSTKCIKIQL